MKQHILLYLFFLVSFEAFSQNIVPNEVLIFMINDSKGNDALYDKYSIDSLANTVKKIHFVGFDTIPHKYALFKNVNTVISESSNVGGLDIFPLLDSLYLIESGGIINEQEDWLKKIKMLDVHKTYSIKGITSFKDIPLLEELVLSYSGFNIFPSDLESLKYIKKIILGAYTGAKINLNLINLEKLPSLQYMEIISWSNNLSGIPSGIKHSNLLKLIIQHPNLTPKEKQSLKAFSYKK